MLIDVEFTGMYDCNGTEIHEGDICELIGSEGKNLFVIKQNIAGKGFAMFPFDGKEASFQAYGIVGENLRVVGNIYYCDVIFG